MTSSLVLGVCAWFIKTVFLPSPEFNPPAIYPALVAFLLTALLWERLIEGSGRVTLLRGGIVGGIVGLLTPVLVWPFFLLSLALSENRFPEIFFWSPVYMFLSLLHASWLAAIPGVVLGVILAYFRRKVNAGQIAE